MKKKMAMPKMGAKMGAKKSALPMLLAGKKGAGMKAKAPKGMMAAKSKNAKNPKKKELGQ